MGNVDQKISLREYQIASIEQVRGEIRQGRKRILLAIPTGGGKTLTSAAILASAVSKGSRVLFVAHRKELIDQTVKTFARLGIYDVGVIRAKDPRRNPSATIQIASIQTLARRDKPDADVVVIDECHRSLAASYQKHLFQHYQNAIFLGLSATPCRTDGKGLGTSYQSLIMGALYSQLIADGFIVEPDVYGTPMHPDLTKVRTTAGDYNLEDLENAVNKSSLIGNTTSEWVKRAGGRKTVVFAVSVDHSKALCASFDAVGARAGHIDGTTPEADRSETLAKLERGELDVICNVGVLCEGWDMPSCKCLVLARPTKSLGLYMQMAGRILRPFGDQAPLILDHGGNVDRHGMPHEDREWSLDAKVKKGGAAPAKACPACFAYVAASCTVCPFCEHRFAAAKSGGEREEKDVLPVELALRSIDGPDAQLTHFRSLARQASLRGWKPGAVAHRFKERWGFWPPAGWMPGVKRGLAKDPEYQAKRAQRDANGE